jgi:hypothetical protein
MITIRPLISLKVKHWSTYEQSYLLASEASSSSVSKSKEIL